MDHKITMMLTQLLCAAICCGCVSRSDFEKSAEPHSSKEDREAGLGAATDRSATVESVTFQNGEVTLAGTLVKPSSLGQHPAVIFVHGDGPMRRDSEFYAPLWSAFAAKGFACLLWDKPGVGRSGGNWLSQTMEDRAVEVRSAMKFLRTKKDIDARRIGMWGISQAGWVMPLVTEGQTDVAFMISVSGPISWIEQGRYLLESYMRAEKSLSDSDIQKGLAFWTQNVDLLRHGGSFEEFKRLATQSAHESWAQAPKLKSFLATTPDRWAFYRKTYLSDARPALEKTRIPVLAIFGELDKNVPPRESAEMYRKALKRASNPDVTIRVLPKADHTLRIGEIFAPEYIPLMTDWLTRHFPNT